MRLPSQSLIENISVCIVPFNVHSYSSNTLRQPPPTSFFRSELQLSDSTFNPPLLHANSVAVIVFSSGAGSIFNSYSTNESSSYSKVETHLISRYPIRDSAGCCPPLGKRFMLCYVITLVQTSLYCG